MRVYLGLAGGKAVGPRADASVHNFGRIMKNYLVMPGDGKGHASLIRATLAPAIMKTYLATWPFGAGGDPRDIARSMKTYMGLSRPADAGASAGSPAQVARSMHKGAPMINIAARPLRLLLSYHYYRDEDLGPLLAECFGDMELDIFADSGAFSAWSTGVPITVKEYADWLCKWGHLFSAAAALDVIGDGKASHDQTVELCKLVPPTLTIVPVFHAVDIDLAWLTRYIDEGYNYIGISPTGLRRRGEGKLIPPWLARVFKMRPEGTRYHGFAVTSWNLMRNYDWYSVDSSSWTAGFRYAQLQLFDDRRGRIVQISMTDRNELLQNSSLLARYGLRPTQARSKGYDRDQLCAVSVESWQRAEEFLTKLHGGPKTYLAASADSGSSGGGRVDSMAKGLRAYLSIGASGPGAPNRPEILGPALRKGQS